MQQLTLNRHDEALREIEQARALDPGSSSILADRAEILRLSGRTAEALAILRQLEATEPAFASPHRYMRYYYLDSGDYPNFPAEMKPEATIVHDDWLLAQANAAAQGYAQEGEHGLFSKLLAEQLKLYGEGKIAAYQLARSEAHLGNNREALRYLALSVNEREESLFYLTVDPAFTNFHGDPAFQQIVSRTGISVDR